MNWKDLAGPLIAAGFPALGRVIGSTLPFPGGETIGASLGTWAGNRIAIALGVEPTPEAVAEAIERSTPGQLQENLAGPESEAVAKYKAAAAIAEAQAEVGKAQVEAVNEAIIAEKREDAAGGDGWLGKWRGIHAWELTIECPFFAGAFLYCVVTGKSESINALITLQGLIMAYFAARFGVLGVHVWQGSNERQVALTGVPATVAKAVAKAVKR
jgi:hypothetical protein